MFTGTSPAAYPTATAHRLTPHLPDDELHDRYRRADDAARRSQDQAPCPDAPARRQPPSSRPGDSRRRPLSLAVSRLRPEQVQEGRWWWPARVQGSQTPAWWCLQARAQAQATRTGGPYRLATHRWSELSPVEG